MQELIRKSNVVSLNTDNSGLLIPFAKNVPGEYSSENIVTVADAMPGRVWCIECNQPLIIKKGERKAHHLAHKTTDRVCNTESLLHKLGKDALFNVLREKRKPIAITSVCKWGHKTLNDISQYPFVVEMEKTKQDQDKIVRPDLSLSTPDNPFFMQIEVVVTHYPEKEAIDFYNRNNSPVLNVVIEDFKDINRLSNYKITGSWAGDSVFSPCIACQQMEIEAEIQRKKREEEDRIRLEKERLIQAEKEEHEKKEKEKEEKRRQEEAKKREKDRIVEIQKYKQSPFFKTKIDNTIQRAIHCSKTNHYLTEKDILFGAILYTFLSQKKESLWFTEFSNSSGEKNVYVKSPCISDVLYNIIGGDIVKQDAEETKEIIFFGIEGKKGYEYVDNYTSSTLFDCIRPFSFDYSNLRFALPYLSFSWVQEVVQYVENEELKLEIIKSEKIAESLRFLYKEEWDKTKDFIPFYEKGLANIFPLRIKDIVFPDDNKMLNLFMNEIKNKHPRLKRCYYRSDNEFLDKVLQVVKKRQSILLTIKRNQSSYRFGAKDLEKKNFILEKGGYWTKKIENINELIVLERILPSCPFIKIEFL